MSVQSGSIVDLLTIAEAFAIVTGMTVSGPERSGRLRVQCPSRGHADGNPSCDLSPAKRAWRCRSCGAGGGLLDLAIAAGYAHDRAEAARWFEERLACRATPPRFHQSPRHPQRKPSANEIEREVAHELERILAAEEETLGCRPATLSRHIAAARRRAGERFSIKLKPPAVSWWEVEPHATDPLFRLIVGRALEERAWACNGDVAMLAEHCAKNGRVAEAVLGDAVAMLRELAT